MTLAIISGLLAIALCGLSALASLREHARQRPGGVSVVLLAGALVLFLVGLATAQSLESCPDCLRRCASTTTVPTTSTTTTTVPVADGWRHFWSVRMGGTVLADSAPVKGVAIDAQGNVYAVGSFTGTVDLGGGPVTSLGRADAFLVKRSPDGVFLWAKTFGERFATDQFATAVAVDPQGNVVVTGWYYGNVSFGGTALQSVAYDAFLTSFTPSGAHRWSKRIGGLSYDLAHSVAIDSAGDIVLAGQFAGAVDFGGGTVTSAGSNDGFVAKYAGTTGAYRWAHRFGGPGLDIATSVRIDPSDNPVVVGYYGAAGTFAGVPLSHAGSNDAFAVSLSSAGSVRWALRFGDVNEQRALAVATDPSGNVLLAGYFGGQVSFGGPVVENQGGAPDIFVAKLTTAGAHVWSRAFGTTLGFGDLASALVTDSWGEVYVTGHIIGPVNFGGGALVAEATYDPFVLKLAAANGAHRWSRRFIGRWDDHGSSIAIGARLVLGGDFAEAINFGGATLPSPGGMDGFMVDPELGGS